MNQLSNSFFFAIAGTLGQSILVETFKSAAYYATHSNAHITEHKAVSRIKEGSACFIFIQGTGLDNFIDRYCMDYDPDKLRQGFNYCLHKRFHL